MDRPDTPEIAGVLAEAWFTSGEELRRDTDLLDRLLHRIARAPGGFPASLERFPEDRVAPIANSCLGTIEYDAALSEAFSWFEKHVNRLDLAGLAARLERWQQLRPAPLTELVFWFHFSAPAGLFEQVGLVSALYESPGPDFRGRDRYGAQAEVALIALAERRLGGRIASVADQPVEDGKPLEPLLLKIIRALPEKLHSETAFFFRKLVAKRYGASQPLPFTDNRAHRRELADAVEKLGSDSNKHRVFGLTEAQENEYEAFKLRLHQSLQE